MKTTIREVIVRLALSARGIPYISGGSTPAEGMDCSGFVVWLLQVAGVLQRGDWTAQSLSDVFGPRNPPPTTPLRSGDLVVYGADRLTITHVMMITGPAQLTGASGGNSRTTTRAAAELIGASVHNRHARYRKDIVGYLLIPYPDET